MEINEEKLIEDLRIKNEYLIKMNYFRYNLAHADESKYLPPLLVEKIMANAIKETRKEMEEKNIFLDY